MLHFILFATLLLQYCHLNYAFEPEGSAFSGQVISRSLLIQKPRVLFLKFEAFRCQDLCENTPHFSCVGFTMLTDGWCTLFSVIDSVVMEIGAISGYVHTPTTRHVMEFSAIQKHVNFNASDEIKSFDIHHTSNKYTICAEACSKEAKCRGFTVFEDRWAKCSLKANVSVGATMQFQYNSMTYPYAEMCPRLQVDWSWQGDILRNEPVSKINQYDAVNACCSMCHKNREQCNGWTVFEGECMLMKTTVSRIAKVGATSSQRLLVS